MAWLNEWLVIQAVVLGYWAKPLVAVLIFLVFLLVRNIFTRFVFNRVVKWLGNTRAEWIHSLLQAYERPLRTFWIVLGLYLGINVLSIPGWDVWVDKLFRSAILILAAWGLFHFTGVTSSWMVRLGQRFDVHVDRIFLPFLSRALRVVIVVLTFTVLAQEWGYRIEGFIAGLGLGGLAVSLAAKDLLANLFGGLAIITEKHFTIGDWIQTPTVEGVVEGITFRSTLVRTFDQALVTVPNSILANEAIKNWSKMGKRRVTFHLGLSCFTPREKIERTVRRIREMLENHPDVHPETIWVYFEKFGESSFDIIVYFFTKPTAAGEYYRVREECNLKILEILEEEGVELAFPSRTLYVEEMTGLQFAVGGATEAKRDVVEAATAEKGAESEKAAEGEEEEQKAQETREKEPEQKPRPFPAD